MSFPFSWEDKPGISKLVSACVQEEESPKSVGRYPLSFPNGFGRRTAEIPPPPCPDLQVSSRSHWTMKRLWQPAAEDPFLAALKKCSRGGKNVGVSSAGLSERNLVFFLKRIKLVFSCKQGCDIREDGLINRLYRARQPCPALPTEQSLHRKFHPSG
ncbi:hypothetical protein Nepgr_016701 [Nepenthes gracilis]|uniref:Uncharacterized protein n=1 Tax=Nepenthes gracilis TaxID=150966 RepID=A0AAD3SQ73_NEPGR|nr:hypothetical protein Nepgr_016701 [Nepenthes gracilis]